MNPVLWPCLPFVSKGEERHGDIIDINANNYHLDLYAGRSNSYAGPENGRASRNLSKQRGNFSGGGPQGAAPKEG